LIGSTLTRKT
jgi:hypothetical protein